MEITRALKILGPDASKIQVLFITLDPQRDTSQILKVYLGSFDPRIVGLSGTSQQLTLATQEYGAYAAPHRTGPGINDYVLDHSSYLYLMDPDGSFNRAFDAETSGDDIALRLAEIMRKPPGKGSLAGLAGTSSK